MTPDRSRPPAYSQTFDIEIKEAVTRYFGNTPVHYIQAGNQDVIKLEVLFPGAGSRADILKGQSYLTWKLLSQGAGTRSAEEIAETIDQYGGFIENSPSLDTPSITLYCLNRHLEKLLPVLHDMVTMPSFPEEEFELTRGIVREQLRVQNNKNNIIASKLFREKLFGAEHPYGMVMQEDDLDLLDRDSVAGFYRENGRQPEVLVSGKVSDEQIESIGKFLESPENDIQKQEFSLPAFDLNQSRIYEEKEKSLQTSLRIGLATIGKTHEDYIPLKIATHALGGYFGSRLMKNIREDKGYTYGIYSSLVSLEHAAYFMIGSDVQKDNREDAVNEIHREIENLVREPLRIDELQMVKNHLLGSFQSSLSSPLALAEKFKSVHYFGLDYGYYQRLVQKIQDITAAEISSVIEKYLPADKMLHVMIG